MFLERFIKKNFISFYEIENDKFSILKEIVKNKNVIESEKKEFTKEELKKFIKNNLNENPQTYVSTILTTINQGFLNSCKKEDFKKEGIDTTNLKVICIDDKYSFYTTRYEINLIKEEFFIDFLYSIFAIIDINAKNRKNSLYVLILPTTLSCMIFYQNIPQYADIVEIEEKNEEIENIEDIDDILNDLDEEIVEIEEEESESIEHINIEKKLLDFLKNSIKEYYEKGSDFIEEIIILSTLNINPNITNLIEEELIIKTTIQEFDILKEINKISRNYA